MSVKNRIKQYPACEVINLTDAEKNIYSGSGWKLARFVEGELLELFDPSEFTEYQPDVEAMSSEAIRIAMAWMLRVQNHNADPLARNERGEHPGGEVWLVMCSCYQLCAPRRITLTDAGALAHMARMIGDELAAT